MGGSSFEKITHDLIRVSFSDPTLIEYFEEGEEIVLTAADLFDLESDDIEEFQEEDFWDEHSLDAQRYYSTICHVYGSNPKKYDYLKKDAKFTNDKAELCVDEYEQLTFSWSTLLRPIFKEAKQLQSD